MSSTTPCKISRPHTTVLEWSAYSQEVKVDLTSHAWAHQGKVVLIDPITADDTVLAEIKKMGEVTTILLTSGNHERATQRLRETFHVPVCASAYAFKEFSFMPDVVVDDVKNIHGLHPIPLPGAGAGEFAFYDPLQRFLFLGDALINLEEKLALLPEQYCTDHAQLKKSVGTLVEYELDGIGFAHGPWLDKKPRRTINALLDSLVR